MQFSRGSLGPVLFKRTGLTTYANTGEVLGPWGLGRCGEVFFWCGACPCALRRLGSLSLLSLYFLSVSCARQGSFPVVKFARSWRGVARLRPQKKKKKKKKKKNRCGGGRVALALVSGIGMFRVGVTTGHFLSRKMRLVSKKSSETQKHNRTHRSDFN